MIKLTIRKCNLAIGKPLASMKPTRGARRTTRLNPGWKETAVPGHFTRVVTDHLPRMAKGTSILRRQVISPAMEPENPPLQRMRLAKWTGTNLIP